jgi:hypothetical protein
MGGTRRAHDWMRKGTKEGCVDNNGWNGYGNGDVNGGIQGADCKVANAVAVDPLRKKRRVLVKPHVIQFPAELGSEISEYEIDDENNANNGGGESDTARHAFRDETWFQEFFTYDSKHIEYIGRKGISYF